MVSLRIRQPHLHGLDCFWYIAVTRNKDDGHIPPFSGNALLQLETVESRKRNVEHETARNKCTCSIEEFLCGSNISACQPWFWISGSAAPALAHGAKPAPVGSPARIRASDLRAPDRGFDSERRNDHLGSTIPAQNPAREIVFVSSEKANSF